MEQTSISKLKFYSLGLVAKNKPLTSKSIEVTPIEDFPMIDGEVNDHKEKYKSSSKDANDSVTNVHVDTTVSIKATWLPINNSNRKTAPDVRRGETVVLYQFADTDKYYWNTMFDDIKLRRLETVIYSFSNNSKENVPDDAESTYYLEVSTHRKLMHIHTSKNDGEPFAYDVQIDAKNGVITFTDDADNFFILNSRDKRLTMHNADGSILDIDKKTITLDAKSVFINGETIVLKGNSISLDGENAVFTAQTIKAIASAGIFVNSPNTNID